MTIADRGRGVGLDIYENKHDVLYGHPLHVRTIGVLIERILKESSLDV